MGKPKKERSVKVDIRDDHADHEGAPLKGKHRQKGNPKKGKGKGGRGPHDYGLDDLERELAAAGLRVKGVSADGNCFFRALSDQLHGNEGAHGELRGRVMAHVEEHRELFEPFVEDDEPFAKYLARMRKDGTWAGNIELQAASTAVGANIAVYQAGQPVWTIKNFPEHFPAPAGAGALQSSPTLHLSYHDGQHYNSVRLAGDFGFGPPQPIVLAAAAADAAAAAAARRGQGGWGEEEVGRVVAGTACASRGWVEQALQECGGNVDQAIELVIERMAQEDGSAGDGAGASGTLYTPVAATAAIPPPTLATATTANTTTTARSNSGQKPPEGPPAGPCLASEGVAAAQGLCGDAAAGAEAAGAEADGGLEERPVELLLRPAAGCLGSIVAELQLARSGSCSQAGAAGEREGGGAEPAERGLRGEEHAGEESHSVEDGAAPSAAQEQQLGRKGKRGVKLKGKGRAAGGKEGAKPPSRNKPCPCGSKQKYKNCCGAKRGSGGGAVQGDGAGHGGSGDGSAAAVQLQKLYI